MKISITALVVFAAMAPAVNFHLLITTNVSVWMVTSVDIVKTETGATAVHVVMEEHVSMDLRCVEGF